MSFSFACFLGRCSDPATFGEKRRHRLPPYEWSVTVAPDESAYGTDWWRRRAWAKTWLGETERFAWWELVDRWRYGQSG